jgi:hypothetical protein
MTTLEQPADEPVAWLYDWHADGEIVSDWVSRDYDEAHSPTMGCHNIRPLYTRPQPARKWVGLTDDEIFEIHKQVDSMQYLTFGKAIEAKLKEKNI